MRGQKFVKFLCCFLGKIKICTTISFWNYLTFRSEIYRDAKEGFFLPLSSSVSLFFCFMPYLRIFTIFYIPNVHFIWILDCECFHLSIFLTFLKSYFAYFLVQFKRAIGLAQKIENLVQIKFCICIIVTFFDEFFDEFSWRIFWRIFQRILIFR